MSARVAVVAALFVLPGCHKPTPEEAAPAPIAVKVRAARAETLKDILSAPGTVVPAPVADLMVIAPEVCEIAELPQPEGAVVKAGDVLVRFNISSVSADLTDKQHDVEEATIRLNGAKAELQKQRALYAQAVIPKNAVDAAAGAVSAAETTLAHAETLLKSSSTLAGRAIVRAPFGGIVLKRFHAEGEAVKPSTDDPVLRLVDPTRVQIAVRVTPGQLVRINPGQAAGIIDATQGTNAAATVVNRPLVTDQNAASAEVRIALTDPAALALDAIVQAEIVLDVREGVIAIPTTAIQRADATSYVMIAGSDGKAHRRDVQLGLVAGALTEIMSGVAAGDQVIVSPLDQVTDGTAIEIER
jgi:membrane fusion protein (multidrug efflux system)